MSEKNANAIENKEAELADDELDEVAGGAYSYQSRQSGTDGKIYSKFPWLQGGER